MGRKGLGIVGRGRRVMDGSREGRERGRNGQKGAGMGRRCEKNDPTGIIPKPEDQTSPMQTSLSVFDLIRRSYVSW